MKRRLFNVLAGLSLLLCMATAVMWVRSYHFWDALHYCSTKDASGLYYDYSVESEDGKSIFQRGWRTYQSAPEVGRFYGGISLHPKDPFSMQIPMGNPSAFRIAGFYIDYYRWTAHRWVTVGIPEWFILIATGFLPGWWIVAKRKRRRQACRQANHLCLTCGYDLRATPDRCPECGTIPAKDNPIST